MPKLISNPWFPVLSFACCAFIGPLRAQPVVAAGGVVNSANYAPVGQPNAPIAQGSIFTVFGTGMGPDTPASPAAYPLQTTLAGTSIAVTSGTAQFAAIPLYVSPTQVSAILPSATPIGTASLTVTYNGQTSAAATFPVTSSSVGLYTRNAQGSGFVIATDANYQIYTPVYAANPGDAVTLWATGVGPVSGVEANGPLPGDLSGVPVQVWVGLQPAQVLYAGRSGCCAGLDQIAFVVPDGLVGCEIPIAVQTGGVTSNFGALPIAAGNRVCTDPLIPDAQSLLTTWNQRGVLNIGNATVERFDNAYGTGSQVSDYAYVHFSPVGVQISLAGLPGTGTLPVGTCAVYPSFPAGALTYTGLNAGTSLMLTSANGVMTIPPDAYKGYQGPLDSFLNPGPITFSGGGGTDIGPFSQMFTMPPPLTWTNPSSAASIDRSMPVTVTWTGATADELVTIRGYNQIVPYAAGSLNCAAKGSDGQFTVPAFVLQALPANGASTFVATFGLTVQSATVPFSAPGMDYGWIQATYSVGAPAVSYH